MATGEVIDTLVVRLVGDSAQYKKTIKEAKTTTDQFVRDANKRLREMAAAFDKDLNSVKSSTKSTQKAQEEFVKVWVVGANKIKGSTSQVSQAVAGMSRDVSGRMRDARGRFVGEARTMEAEAQRLSFSLKRVLGLAMRAGSTGGAALAGAGRGGRSAINTLGGGANSMMGQVAMAAGVTGGAGLIYKTVSDAANAQESIAKFGAVFGEQTGEATKFVKELADEIGRSDDEIRKAMSAYQSMFVGLDFGREKATTMSMQLEKLTLDFAAFHNISDEEASSRFLSAMSGSAEVLDQFGVNIRQAAIEQELFAMGINKSVQNASEAEKTLARLNLITKVMAGQGALGAAARESESFANQSKALNAEVKDLSIAIGNQLLPLAIDAVKYFKELAGVMQDGASSGSGIRDAFLTVADVIHTIGLEFQNLQAWITEAVAAALSAYASLVGKGSNEHEGFGGKTKRTVLAAGLKGLLGPAGFLLPSSGVEADVYAEEMNAAAVAQRAEADKALTGKTPSEMFAEAQAAREAAPEKEISRDFDRLQMDKNIFQDAAKSFADTVTEAGQTFGMKAYWELFGIGNDMMNWTKEGPEDSFAKATAGSAVRFGSAESEISRSQKLDDEMEKKTQKLVDNTEAQKRLSEKANGYLQSMGQALSQTTSLPF